MSRDDISYWRFKSIRDPIHGFVSLTERETRLINTLWLLRLQRINQLGHTYLVYPSATHKRYEHSLGAMYVADQIAVNIGLDKHQREVVRAAALLHDVGHGPFSHVFEEFLQDVNGEGFTHEYLTYQIVKNDEEIKSILKGEGVDAEDVYDEVVNILNPELESYEEPILRDIINSSLDCDKLDYLLRDSYHLGVKYGMFDLQRILHTITKTKDGKKLCIKEKGKDALENYRLGRHLMHAQVYEHHTRLIAESMFLLALDIAKENNDFMELFRFDKNNPTKFLSNYISLDDHEIYRLLKEIKGKSKNIIEMLEKRKLLKRALVIDIEHELRDVRQRKKLVDMKDKKELRNLADEIARRVGVEPEYIVCRNHAISIKLYEKYGFYVLKEDEHVEDLDNLSPFSSKVKSLIYFYVFSHESVKDKVAKAFSDITGIQITK
jgi:HD superfamily phosphohydrolase